MKLPVIITSLALAFTTATGTNILTLHDSVFDPNIVYPESLDTDVNTLMQNWYLQNYTQLDDRADSRPIAEVTDEELISRLQRIPTTIEMPYNSVVRQYIDVYTQKKRSLVESMLGMSLYYMPIFEQALDKYQLPLELRYLPIIESALNPSAVSRVGATGLWQFMMPTATGQGLEISTLVDERRDPIASSDAAARYLKQLHEMLGDWSLAIAAYNCGPGTVTRALKRAGGGKQDFWQLYPYLPKETRGYVPAFIAATYVMNYYRDHNISPALARRPMVVDTVHVAKRVHFQQISDVLGIPMDALRTLNPQYRTDLIPGDIRPYALVLPSLQVGCYVQNEDSIVNHNAELYARRDVVEPSQATETKVEGQEGEWVTETVVKYHKVRRNETLASIARKYGVTASSIKRANGIGKKVRRGQTLKINTTRRTFIPAPAAPADSTTVTQPEIAAEVTTTPAAPADSASVAKVQNEVAQGFTRTNAPEPTPEAAEEPASVKKPAPEPKKKKEPKPRTTTYTVRNGDSLYKIAARYPGVTADDIQRANNLRNANIQPGQKLTIPASTSSKSSRKSSRRRR